MFIGIDQSYSGFGLTFLWSEGADPDPFGSDTVVHKFPPKKSSGVNRLKDIEAMLKHEMTRNYLREGNIDHICMEGYANGSKFGREVAGELGAVVKMTLLNLGISGASYPTIVPPTSLKKFVTGSGTAKKNEMLLGVYKKWNADFKDDNAADSYGLAMMARALHYGDTPFQYEKDILAKLTKNTEKATA